MLFKISGKSKMSLNFIFFQDWEDYVRLKKQNKYQAKKKYLLSDDLEKY